MTHDPKTDRMELRTNASFSDQIEARRRKQPKIPSRSSAVRQLVEIALKHEASSAQ
ncbi:MAG: hypothetical protein WCF85_18990 [Rhodospirillaceae bacterium]